MTIILQVGDKTSFEKWRTEFSNLNLIKFDGKNGSKNPFAINKVQLKIIRKFRFFVKKILIILRLLRISSSDISIFNFSQNQRKQFENMKFLLKNVAPPKELSKLFKIWVCSLNFKNFASTIIQDEFETEFNHYFYDDYDICILVAQNANLQDFTKIFKAIFDKHKNFKELNFIKPSNTNSLINIWAKTSLIAKQIIKNIDFQEDYYLENLSIFEIGGIKILNVNVDFKHDENVKIKQKIEKIRELANIKIG